MRPRLRTNTPALATTGDTPVDETLVVNGQINVRKTHPGLYRLVMLLAASSIALGINFVVFVPTFYVYGFPHELWAACFLALGVSKLVFLNVWRSLRLTRAVMGIEVAYTSVFALGTMQPALEGVGSLQLPILYLTLVVLEVALLLEPFINPYTARRE